MRHTLPLLMFALWLPSPAAADDLTQQVKAIAGDGVVLVVDASGEELVSLNAERPFIPASTLKVVTALASMEVLGADYRFSTHFYLDEDKVLYVEGHGDPYLISEELDLLAPALLQQVPKEFAGLVLDDSYFEPGITIPGTSRTDNPYDALNTALAVNFNTINVRIHGSEVVSAEEQTPLVPLAEHVARESGRSGKVRINLTDDPQRSLHYAGELIRAKLEAHGAMVADEIRVGTVPEGLEPVYIHENSRPVSEVVAGMLKYSNNYMANQLVLEMGVVRSGAPATLDKGMAVVHEVLEAHGLTEGITAVEGSGLSRNNEATAAGMLKLLDAFAPHKELMRDRRGALAKTGSLSVTKTIIGYLETAEHGEVRFIFGLDGRCWEERFQLIDLLKKSL
jgi:serine-type D-Ala-D-Ala carboxypeptidase/endopeptidase (penicillin-binding protein 4)